jgi:hypothetical protein
MKKKRSEGVGRCLGLKLRGRGKVRKGKKQKGSLV